MKSILSSILLLTPAVLALPAPQTTAPSAPISTKPAQTCSQKSQHFVSWELVDFTYSPLAPSSEDDASVPETSVSFAIVHNVIEHQTICTATSQTAFDGTETFDCEDVPTGDDPSTFEGGMAQFSFDASTGNVTLTQRWICHDDPIWPTYFTALGSGIAGLGCPATGSTSEDVASTADCAGSTVQVNVTEISAIA